MIYWINNYTNGIELMPDDQENNSNENLTSKTCTELLNIGELLSLKDAAKLSGFSHSYLTDIAGSRLCAKRIGSYWITTLAAVEEYKRSRSHKLKKDLK